MHKVIIISENQRRLLQEDESFAGYLSNHDDGVGGTHETNVDGICLDSNGETDISSSKPYHSEKFDWEVVKQHNIVNGVIANNSERRGGIIAGIAESKKKIEEDNQNLKNNRYYLPDELYQTLQQSANTLGEKAPKRLLSLLNSKDKGISYKEMYRLKGVLDGTDKTFNGDVNCFGGDSMKQWVNNSLNNDTSIDKRNRTFQRDVMGKTNAFKNANNGKGHRQQETITYF